MSNESGLEDTPLIDLFRAEVETHSESLTAALLALERYPGDKSRIDEMMRAAHSIKGASRIVGVDLAARLAHVMEDCFLAAQKGTIEFSPGDVDVLLRGVDLVGKISEATRDPNTDLAHEFGDLVQAFVAEIEALNTGEGKSSGRSAGRGTAAVASPATLAAKSAPGAPAAPVPASPPVREVTIAFPEILDSAAAEGIRRQVQSAIDSQCETIRFDLQATKDLDVEGLALLAAVPQHLAEHSRSSLQLAGVSIEMATVLRVNGLAQQYGVRR